ncbi:MAG: RNA polymerase sigma factor SigW, partial [Deltaproteobacteria bacterium]|nr:RNA polymerase sigma factor SigW [Deltaproteobacteria bacterium]
MDPIAEKRFVQQLKAGNEAAFTELVRLYQHSVFNLVLRLLDNREEAEDVAQE